MRMFLLLKVELQNGFVWKYVQSQICDIPAQKAECACESVIHAGRRALVSLCRPREWPAARGKEVSILEEFMSLTHKG